MGCSVKRRWLVLACDFSLLFSKKCTHPLLKWAPEFWGNKEKRRKSNKNKDLNETDENESGLVGPKVNIKPCRR